MKKILIFILLFIASVYLSGAININLGSGEKLENNIWTNLSSVLNKVNISGGDININGKFNIDGKIIDIATGKALGECEISDADWSKRQYWKETTCVSLSPVTNFRVTSKNTTEIALAWYAVTDATDYFVRNVTDDTNWQSVGSNLNYIYTGLISGKEYQFHIVAQLSFSGQPVNSTSLGNVIDRTNCPSGQVLDGSTCVIPASTPN